MIVDIAKLMAEEKSAHEERHRERWEVEAWVWLPARHETVLQCEQTEANVLACMLMGGEWLAACEDVELGDFTNLRYRRILTSIRELQMAGTEVEPMSVADDIALRDIENATHCADSIDICFVTGVLCKGAVRVSPASALLESDRGHLRALADRRRAA